MADDEAKPPANTNLYELESFSSTDDSCDTFNEAYFGNVNLPKVVSRVARLLDAHMYLFCVCKVRCVCVL